MSSGVRFAGTVTGIFLIVQGIGSVAQRQISPEGRGWYLALYLSDDEFTQTVIAIVAVLLGIVVLYVTRNKEKQQAEE